MKVQDATMDDLQELKHWTVEKSKKYKVRLEDLEASFMKAPGVFYCAARPTLFIGPLIPNPQANGKTLGLALVRMIKDIRKNFTGDIIYLTRGMPDGIDELAERVGFFREDGSVMRLRGHHGM